MIIRIFTRKKSLRAFLICFLYFFKKKNLCSDPRVREWLFMSNPFKMFGILGLYLLFILKWGPNHMKNRQPYNLNKVIIVYNIIQIIACARLVLMVRSLIWFMFIVRFLTLSAPAVDHWKPLIGQKNRKNEIIQQKKWKIHFRAFSTYTNLQMATV